MVETNWLERILLLLLMALSGYLFWRRFGKVVARIRAAKKDPDWRLERMGKRVWDFVWEVMLQAKVIRERPLPGLAHAFVFWGFTIFALVTVAHFAEGFGLQLFSPEHGFGRIYFSIAGVFAVAVAVSIAGLVFRRFVIHPRWLGKVSPESGIIGLLIFLLMVTYLARFWGPVANDHVLAHMNWWAHALIILGFLPLVPHTKHLHLVLSPVTVFLKRGSFSHIPPLVGDDDFGLDTGKDLTNLVTLQAYSCVECGRCSEHCPATNTGKLLNPKEVILGVRAYLNDYGPGSEEPLLGKYISQEAVFQCTTCGGCEYQCPVGIEHLPIMVGLRRGAVNTGKWEDDYGTKLFLNLERNGNALGLGSSERDKFIQKNNLPFYDGTQEYCLWLGCMGAYDPQGREIVLALARVLQHVGVTFGVLKKEKCSGDPARRTGNDLTFGQLVEFNSEQMKASKVNKLVSICPHCVRTLSEDYKELDAAVSIEHHSELLARYAPQLPHASNSDKIVFHDPCYLGRYRDVYDEPRQVAALGGEVVDPERARQRSFCCGAGGGLAFLGEEKGKRVSVERAEQLVATGANVVGAACPFCNTMFRDALAGITKTPPKLLDIAQIAAAALERTEN